MRSYSITLCQLGSDSCPDIQSAGEVRRDAISELEQEHKYHILFSTDYDEGTEVFVWGSFWVDSDSFFGISLARCSDDWDCVPEFHQGLIGKECETSKAFHYYCVKVKIPKE